MASGTEVTNQFDGAQSLRNSDTTEALSNQAANLFTPISSARPETSKQSEKEKQQLEESFFKNLSWTTADSSLKNYEKPEEKKRYPELQNTTSMAEIGGQVFKIANPEWNKPSPERSKFMEEQNKLTEKAIDPVERQRMALRLTELMNYPWQGHELQTNKDGTSFSFTNDGKQNKDVLVRQGADGKQIVVLDPNEFGENTYISGVSPSPDGRYIAYAKAENSKGDWNVWRIRDTQTGKDLDDSINWTKIYNRNSVSWAADGKGFYYTRLPEPKKGEELTSKNENLTMMFHKLGDKQEQDRVVVKPDDPNTFVTGAETEDGRYLVTYTSSGTGDSLGVAVRDLKNPDKPPVVLSTTDNGSRMVMIGSEGSTFYMQTDKDAPKGKVIAIDINDPTKLKEVIAQPIDFKIEEVVKVGNSLVVSGLRDGQSVVKIYDNNGKPSQDVELPGAGKISQFSASEGSDKVRFAYSSMTQPNTLMELDTKSGELKTTFAPKVNFNPADYVTELKYVPNGEGRDIPVYIAHRKDIKLDGNNPTIMNVYGGFAQRDLPTTFSSANILWLEKGILVTPVLPGDGRDKTWHDEGRGLNKENTYKGVEAVARYLHTNGYSSPETTGIKGDSNGGLTAGATIVRESGRKLFKAAIIGNRLLSMGNYDTNLNPGGRAWKREFLNPKDPEAAKIIRSYDPLTNIPKDGKLPDVLVKLGENDNRVGPANSFAFVTVMQELSKGEVLMLSSDTGHNGATNQNSFVEDVASDYTYFSQRLRKAKP